MQRIQTTEQLRAMLGDALPLTRNKIYDHVFADAAAFIAKTPLIFVATSDRQGQPTVSPKGDAPGFVQVEDEHTLLIPERPGNKLLHGFCNILDTGQIGLIFVLPGTGETLRINGTAQLFHDPDTCAAMAANGKDALLVTRVSVRECFFHCAKAFKRSHAWEPQAWSEPLKLSFGKQIAQKSAGNKIARKALEMAIDQAVNLDYKKNL